MVILWNEMLLSNNTCSDSNNKTTITVQIFSAKIKIPILPSLPSLPLLTMMALIILTFTTATTAASTTAWASCGENEILLRNRTCLCPFFRLHGKCVRRRYQTTVNATLAQIQSAARHLLMDNTPLLLTIDASNHEAMQALAASLAPLMPSAPGTVVTSVVDAMDVLVGGEPSASMEIVNASVSGTVLTLTVDYRLPAVDYFFWFMHFGASPAPCPPFDVMDGCCRGDMGSAEFLTTTVDCSSRDPMGHMEQFVAQWDGSFSDNHEQFTVSVDLEKHRGVPSTTSNGATIYRLGIGMVVFGRLAQNTESRVEIQLNSSVTSTSVGAFQYSGIEFSRLQLETCGGEVVFMHLVVKAANIEAVQSMRFQVGDDAVDWMQPNCSVQSRWVTPQGVSLGCNVSIDSEFVSVYVPLPKPFKPATSFTLYVLLLSRGGSVLTRVVARADGAAIAEHCKAPLVIKPGSHAPQYIVDVLQGNRVKYSGQADFVQLTDVAALTLRVRSNLSAYRYSIDNISVVYSLVNSSIILGLMPDGKVTPQLEALCDSGNVCLIETLLESGACATHEKCEVQGGNGVFVMPLYPWGMETLRKEGTYTAMLVDVKEETVAVETTTPPTSKSTSTTTLRRLMGWIGL